MMTQDVEDQTLEDNQEANSNDALVGDSEADIQAFLTAFRAMQPLDRVARARAYRWLGDKLGVRDEPPPPAPRTASSRGSAGADSKPEHQHQPHPNQEAQNEAPTPQGFITSKKPTTLNERVACLGYYLTHYRNTPSFRPVDIDNLNIEARQPRIGNPRSAVDNATRDQYLHVSGSGVKGLSTRGEAVVVALPDRAAVAEALEEHPHTTGRTRSKATKRASKKAKE